MIAKLAFLLLPACLAFGQTTFYFTHAESPQLQPAAGIVTLVAGVRDVTIDEAKRAIAMSGTEGQVTVATWILHELDRSASSSPGIVKDSYPGADSGGEPIRVYFLAHMENARELQEVLNATRSAADVQFCAPYSALNAVVVRTTAGQMALADWMLSELDSTDARPGTSLDFPMPGDRAGNLAQLFFLANTQTPQAIQEIVNAARSVSDIQRLFPLQVRHALVIRASAEQVALADWMLKQLDWPAGQPPAAPSPLEFRFAGSLARVFFLNPAQTAESLQRITNTVRTAVQAQRAYPNNQAKAISMRGTGDQIARAAQLIKELDR
jgi:type II secretory pathway component GspD/PulD (secretin)